MLEMSRWRFCRSVLWELTRKRKRSGPVLLKLLPPSSRNLQGIRLCKLFPRRTAPSLCGGSVDSRVTVLKTKLFFLKPGPGGFTFSASIFRRATNQPVIQNRSTYVKWKEILLMPAQRFGEQQDSKTHQIGTPCAKNRVEWKCQTDHTSPVEDGYQLCLRF